MSSREHLATERVNADSRDLDRLPLREALAVFDREDRRCVEAVEACGDSIARAIELVVERLGRGGRLIYAGAGTSGRLGVLDAVECPPTFQSDPRQVEGRIAGGMDALLRSAEGAEDSHALGHEAADDLTPDDVLFGIAAGGTTPFVHAALERARERGAATIFLACVPFEHVPDRADVSIRLATGPEVLQGSTRLKAGTATKLVLNRVTTLAMARLGKVHGNRMVDLETRANEKLRQRGVTLVRDLCELDPHSAAALLDRTRGSVKLACVMHFAACDREEARDRLRRANGFLRVALDELAEQGAGHRPSRAGEDGEPRP